MSASDSKVREGFAPGRLWSLWDMLRFQAHSFVEAMNKLVGLVDIAEGDPSWVYQDDTRKRGFIIYLDRLHYDLSTIGLKFSVRKVEDIKNVVEGNINEQNVKGVQMLIGRKIEELKERIEQELEDRHIYCLDGNAAEYLESHGKFLIAVSSKFPTTLSDLSEASYCIGMSRNTASVFHLMRALESIVVSIGDKLGVTIIDKDNIGLDWGKIIANINTKISTMQKGQEREELAGVASLLFNVKLAWRNTTMHPKTTYTDEEARAVYSASKNFIIHICELF